MVRQARSRSPRGDQSEYISRQLVLFGQYPDQRPKGLDIDSHGFFSLKNIMSAWGSAAGYRDQDVLEAVQKHMFHSGQVGQLRFTLTTGPDGQIHICVQPQRPGGDTAASSNGGAILPLSSKGRGDCDWTPKPVTGGSGPGIAPIKPLQVLPTKAQWKEGKAAEHARSGWGSSPWSGGSGWKSEGWRSPSAWQAGAGRDKARDRGWSEREETHDTQWKSGRDKAEKVQRWIGYMLKQGFKEHRLHVEGKEWLRVDELTELISKRPDLGVEDEIALRVLLMDTDGAGRFEVDGSYIRKVPHHLREARPVKKARIPTIVIDDTSPPATLALAIAAAPADSEAPLAEPAARETQQKAPPKPPGPGWVRYSDEGVIWWYYEGPLGKWWAENESDEPQPFVEESG